MARYALLDPVQVTRKFDHPGRIGLATPDGVFNVFENLSSRQGGGKNPAWEQAQALTEGSFILAGTRVRRYRNTGQDNKTWYDNTVIETEFQVLDASSMKEEAPVSE